MHRLSYAAFIFRPDPLFLLNYFQSRYCGILCMLQHTFYMQNEQTSEPVQNVQLGDHMAATLFHSALEVRKILSWYHNPQVHHC
jgi:hypothetical protein